MTAPPSSAAAAVALQVHLKVNLYFDSYINELPCHIKAILIRETINRETGANEHDRRAEER